MSHVELDLETDAFVLPAPVLPAEATLADALRQRASARTFANDTLTAEQVSALLWAAGGINRPTVGGRTAPSAHNWQEIDISVVLARGSYRYHPKRHQLDLVKAEDLRALTGTQDFVAHAPLNLVYVADFERAAPATQKERQFLVGADAGCMAQNVYLFCASMGLATVVRGLVDRQRLAAALGLRPTQRIALAQTIGLPAPR
ncbi:MAG: SagB/ThcOx family dehydrogenase [Comamonadaceae bacterium]|jgi:SagB-type dehydrogenase family enzyme|nr:SagB/ThcOx family dehydrogenase [Comamonadaceae bacterium]